MSNPRRFATSAGAYVVGAVSDETLRRTRDSVVVSAETIRGRRLVRLTIERPDAPIEARTSSVLVLSGEWADGLGHAILNASAGHPLDDSCDEWIHASEPLADDVLAAYTDSLAHPRATSRGHKISIYAARQICDEVHRLRARVTELEAKAVGAHGDEATIRNALLSLPINDSVRAEPHMIHGVPWTRTGEEGWVLGPREQVGGRYLGGLEWAVRVTLAGGRYVPEEGVRR